MLVPLDPQHLVHLHPAALVERQAEVRQRRVRLHARCPDEGVRQDALAVREVGRAGLQRLERGTHLDLDPALGELARGVLAEAGRDLREDLRRRVDEHPPLRRVPQAGVVAERVADEVGELGQRLDSRVAGPDEDEGQLALPMGLVGCRVGGFEPLQHVVAQVDGVGQVLEAECVIGEPRDRERARDRPERDDEVAVADVHDPLERLDLNAPALEVERRRAAKDELGVWAHRAQGHDHVPRLEGAGGGLRQQRGEEHRVLRADDRGTALAETAGDVAARVPPADDDRAATRLPLAHASTIAAWPGFRSR